MYLNNGGTFSQHTQFLMTSRNVTVYGAAVAEWLSYWLAEQEDRGSIPGLAT